VQERDGTLLCDVRIFNKRIFNEVTREREREREKKVMRKMKGTSAMLPVNKLRPIAIL